MSNKPRIRKVSTPLFSLWECVGETFIGFGDSPKAAYDNYQKWVSVRDFFTKEFEKLHLDSF